jgi:glyoxylase-like metal-dependent hydrolase (beta-lactamase superfamily II)
MVAATPAVEESGPIGPEVTGLATRAAWLAGDMPEIEQVRPGIWAIPVPIPDNPLRYTLAHLLEGTKSCVVVDPGWDAPESWESLLAGLALIGRRPSEISGIVATHAHPDHHGLSARLARRADAWIALHGAERSSLTSSGTWHAEAGVARDEKWLVMCGVPVADRADIAVTGPRWRTRSSELADPDILLEDGQLLPLPGRRVRVVWTPGHTPGHVCLHDEDEDVLLTGDHLLPRISPNIGLQPHTEKSPLAAYLRALDWVRRYRTAEALPGHEWRFRGVDRRAEQLIRHHADRCDELEGLLSDGPAPAWDLASLASWSRPWAAITGLMRRSALAETLAHLEHLRATGRVDRSRDGSGTDVYAALTTGRSR